MSSSSFSSSDEPVVYRASKAAMRTSNPIRLIVDQLKPPHHFEKPPILIFSLSLSLQLFSLIDFLLMFFHSYLTTPALSIGDPTRYGNLKTHSSVTSALCRVAVSGQFDGYPHSCGYVEARRAVAEHMSYEGARLDAENVVLTSGASGALEICIGAMADEGDNILLPCPGF